MPTLISSATGNWTTASTWSLVGNLSDSEALSTSVTTSQQNGASFTPGAITVDGISIKISTRVLSPTGTVVVVLRNVTAGANVTGTTVTLDVADLPYVISSTTNEGGWVFFKFSSSVLLLAATNYSVGLSTSSASQISAWCSSGTVWSYLLRTTTTQAPVALDVLHIMGEHTGGGTGNDITVTMDSTVATDYGAGTDNVVALTVSKRGTLTYGVVAVTNYVLRLSGDAIVYNGGTFNIGTTGVPVPRDSTAVLEFDCVAAGGMGFILRNGHTLSMQGLSRSVGKNIIACKLNTDEIIGQTVLGVDTDTGWLSGDSIAIAKTSRASAVETEQRTLSANANASDMTISAGLTFAHSGTTPTQGDVILLTRNVIFRAVSTSLVTYLNSSNTGSIDVDWATFTNIGANISGKRGLVLQTTTGSCSIQYSTIQNTLAYGLNISGGISDNITFAYNTCYLLNTSAVSNIPFMRVDATTGTTSINISYNYFLNIALNAASAFAFDFNDVGFTFSNNVVNLIQTGIGLYYNQANGVVGNHSNNTIYGSRASGAMIGQNTGVLIGGGSLDGFVAWNNGGVAIRLASGSSNFTINDAVLRGNTATNMELSGGHASLTVNRLISSGNIGATATGLNLAAGSALSGLVFNDCSFGVASGTFTAHTQDIAGSITHVEALFNNCLFGSSTLIISASSFSETSILKFHKFQQNENRHRWYTKFGIAQATGVGLTDTTVRTSGSLGLRIAPTDSATGFSWSFKIPARVGKAVSVLGFIRKNAAFGTDVALVELFLPGSIVADASVTMGNTTDQWLPFTLAASYVGTVDLYAKVKITAKSAATNSYIYVDDLYNGTNSITALDTWDEGRPSDIMFEQLGDASAVWAVVQSSSITAGTTGAKLNELKNPSLIINHKIII